MIGVLARMKCTILGHQLEGAVDVEQDVDILLFGVGPGYTSRRVMRHEFCVRCGQAKKSFTAIPPTGKVGTPPSVLLAEW